MSFFEYAKPVWAKGLSETKNVTCLFRAILPKGKTGKLKLTACSFYRVFVGGEFFAYGPARVAKGFARVDEYALPAPSEDVAVTIEVAGYYCHSFYALQQPSFLQAELSVADGEEVYATYARKNSVPSAAVKKFVASVFTERIRKCPRYSFQRGFAECYRFEENPARIFAESTARKEANLEEIEDYWLLNRSVAYPRFEKIYATATERGVSAYDATRSVWQDRTFSQTKIGIYPIRTWECDSNDVASRLTYRLSGKRELDGSLQENEYTVYALTSVKTGFIGMDVEAETDATIYVIFDEVDNRENPQTNTPMEISFNRNYALNVIACEIKKGKCNFLSFEPYSAKYIKIVARKGKIKINDVYLRTYENAEKDKLIFSCADEKIEAVMEAARGTFAQNAVDILTDCPGRERAGWLCDGYFTAQAEQLFTGGNRVERNFLEAYALRPYTKQMPHLMIPMCYPADFVNVPRYIDNWAMWYIAELHDYYRRTGDKKLVDESEKIVRGLHTYFSHYYNEYGLLENMNVLVSWCKGNDPAFRKGVNFPTNMLYAYVLRLASELYNEQDWLQEAETLQNRIRERSYNGEFFEDNVIRRRGRLVRTGHTSESCLCYAFFCGTATKEAYPALWRKFVDEFGPKRDENAVYPTVYKTAAFIGYYLRLIVLQREGLFVQALDECKDYFYKMAARTGTLWEHDRLEASLNHGFASYAAKIILESLSGISEISVRDKSVKIKKVEAKLPFAAKIPVGEEYLSVESDGKRLRYVFPKGYTVCEIV